MWGSKKLKKNIGIVFLAVTVLAGSIGYTRYARADIKSDGTVGVNPDSLPNGTITIGTHIIYIKSWNAPLNEIAEKSEADYGRSARYYRSELAGGQWFDVSNASSVESINKNGVPVDKSVIADMGFLYHTMADGKTYDLKNNKVINIFEIDDPYDMKVREELEPIRQQYEIIKNEKSKSKRNSRDMESVEYLALKTYKNGESEKYQKQLDALYKYYLDLVPRKPEHEMIEQLTAIMQSVDAARRVEVDNMIIDTLRYTSNQVNDASWDEKVKDHPVNSALVDAVEDSTSQIQEDLDKNKTLAPAPPVIGEGTAMETYRYQLTLDLIAAAEGGNFPQCDEILRKLMTLQTIMESKSKDKDAEGAMIDGTLLPIAKSEFKRVLSEGENQSYKEAKGDTAKAAAVTAYKTELEQKKGELQVLIEAKLNTMQDEKEKDKFILSEISDSGSMDSSIPSGGFESTAKAILEDFRKDLGGDLSDGAGEGSESTLKNLYAEKEKLQAEAQGYLDNENIDAVKRADAKIEDIGKQIEKQEAQVAEEMRILEKQLEEAKDTGVNSQAAWLEGEIAKKKAVIPEGSPVGVIAKQKDKVAEIINSGDIGEDELAEMNSAVNAIASLADVVPENAADAIRDIKDSIDDAIKGGAGSGADGAGKDGTVSGADAGGAGSGAGGADAGGAGSGAGGAGAGGAGSGAGGAGAGGAGSGAGGADSGGAGSGAGGTGAGDAGSGAGGTGADGAGSGAGADGAGSGAGGAGADDAGSDADAAGDESAEEEKDINEEIEKAAADSMTDEEKAEKFPSTTSPTANALKELSNKVGDTLKKVEEKAKDAEKAKTEKQSDEELIAAAGEWAFEELKTSSGEQTAPIDLVAKKLGYRYVWNENKKQAVLSNIDQGTFYKFVVSSMEVEINEGEVKMKSPAKYRNVVYIPASYLESEFSLTVKKVGNSGYSMLVEQEDANIVTNK
ncbi:MAG: hypothetical protein K6G84_07125 [Lachnospiraceae bacterium]|nr:hypothetical protein [Lachnospiraceae bacterium]